MSKYAKKHQLYSDASRVCNVCKLPLPEQAYPRLRYSRVSTVCSRCLCERAIRDAQQLIAEKRLAIERIDSARQHEQATVDRRATQLAQWEARRRAAAGEDA